MNRLFVYGTLAPGQANHEVLDGIPGSWQAATLRGTLHKEGWGAVMDYPAIVPSEEGDEVQGFVFSSPELEEHWSRLDAFEGDDYERVPAKVRLEGGQEVEAYVFALKRAGLPSSLQELTGLGYRGLKAAHRAGGCPNVDDLRGVAVGRILHPAYVEPLRLWRGKVFESPGEEIGGLNRWGLGPFSFQRYRFVVRVGGSAFTEKQLVLLDHDLPGNPGWVRRFHDEMVEMRPGLCLTSSHWKTKGGLRYLSYFSFELADQVDAVPGRS